MPKLPTTSGTSPAQEFARPEVLIARASQAQESGRNDTAIGLYQRALRIDPTNVDVINRLGLAMGLADDLVAAARQFEDSLRIQPDQPEVWFWYAVGLSKLGFTDEALNASERAITLSPMYGAAHLQRSSLLASLGRHEESLAACDAAVRLLPRDSRASILRGEALQWCGRYDEAFMEFDRAIAVGSHEAEASVAKAKLMMLLGDRPGGLSLYEWRWRTIAWHESPRRARRENMRPLWLGETSLVGKTILIYAEQGFGDAINFCRYASLAADAGARVIVETNPPLTTLMKTLRSVSQVISDGDLVPDHDLCCPMMSLPLAFGTTVDTIPSEVPYLHPDPARVSDWRNRLSDLSGSRIGLVWGSGAKLGDSELVATERRKSLPLAKLAPLAAVAGCEFVSLQLGPSATQAASPPEGMVLHDHTAHIHDFADTAALIESLDLVISVCTSTAHLAGAMGKPVWLLNRYDTDWRWMLNRKDTSWYPSMRLFRQPRPGDWESVIQSVVYALHALPK
jgi:tetratricopeptide (TPR) repeat protein